MKSQFTQQPTAILYMPLPDTAKADVWLRKNIREATGEDGEHAWEADEVYFRTVLTEAQVTERFEALFADPPVEKAEEPKREPTAEERLAAIEAAILQLSREKQELEKEQPGK